MSAPLLHLKREPRDQVTSSSIRALVDLLIEIEKRRVSGPWDDWDAVALDQCREVVQRRLSQAYEALDEAIGRSVP